MSLKVTDSITNLHNGLLISVICYQPFRVQYQCLLCFYFQFICRITDPNFLFYVQLSICYSSPHRFVPMLSVYTANLFSNMLVQFQEYLDGQGMNFDYFAINIWCYSFSSSLFTQFAIMTSLCSSRAFQVKHDDFYPLQCPVFERV